MKTNLLTAATGGIIAGLSFKAISYIENKIGNEGILPILYVLLILIVLFVSVNFFTFGKEEHDIKKKLYSPVDKKVIMQILKGNLKLIVMFAFLLFTIYF